MPVEYLLPPAEVRCWTAKTKAAVVQAVERGAISAEEACARWGLSEGELAVWRIQFLHCGSKELRVTHRCTVALLAGLLAFGACPASANDTWALQIYVLPVVANADQGDTVPFYFCATPAICTAKAAVQVPPFGITTGSIYYNGNVTWEFISVPSGGWEVYAGYDGPPRDGLPGGSSTLGQWAVITRDGINIGPTIVGDSDKALWTRWAIKASGISAAATIAGRVLVNPVGRAAATGVAGLAGAAARRFSMIARDPYDPDYQTVTTAAPWSPVPLSGNACGDNAMNAIARAAGIAQAVSTSADRYSSALVNQDNASAGNQASAVGNFSQQLHNSLDPAQTALPGVLFCGPVLSIGVVDAISQLQNDQANGPSPDVTQALANAGITDLGDVNLIIYGDPDTGVPGLANMDPNIAYYAFEALFGPKDGRNSAWAQLDAYLQ